LRVQLVVLAVAILALSNADAVAEKRVALVVGNSAYQNVKRLDNPKNDALLMAKTLQTLGFTLVGGKAQLDLDKPALDKVVQSFGQQVRGADVALFYYAGHGVQVSGSNYLVPVDANPTRETDVDFQMVDANLVLRQMQDPSKRLNLVILDACRNNPFGGRGLGRDANGGLAQMRAPAGTLISYATQPGAVAQDGTDGDSPYTKALAKTISRAGLDVFQTFNQVGLDVERSTGGAQQPWTSSSPIDGNFYFGGAPATAPATNTGPSVDEAAWGFMKDTKDPEQIRRFIAQFPNSVRRNEAVARLVEIAKEEADKKNVSAVVPLAKAAEEAKTTVDAKPLAPKTKDDKPIGPNAALAPAEQANASKTAVPATGNPREPTVIDKCKMWGLTMDRQKQIAACKSWAHLEPKNAEIYRILGDAYYATSRPDEAASAFTKAIALNPDSADLYAFRGSAYSLMGYFDKAIADYTKAIAVKSDFAYAYSNRGTAYAEKGQRDSAISDYRAALKLDPNDINAARGLDRIGAH